MEFKRTAVPETNSPTLSEIREHPYNSASSVFPLTRERTPRLHQNVTHPTMTDYEKQRFIEHWEVRRAGGKTRFVLHTALLFFVMVLVVTILVDLFSLSLSEAVSSNFMLEKLVSKAIFGILLGFLNWYMMERQYRKMKEQP
jgi:hypothetical protein